MFREGACGPQFYCMVPAQAASELLCGLSSAAVVWITSEMSNGLSIHAEQRGVAG